MLHKLDAHDDNENKVLILPRIPMRYGGKQFQFGLTGNQFLLKVTFALIMDSAQAQGQSAAKCGILLPKSVWTHGQMYVAFSRCGNPNNICVWAEQEQFAERGYCSDKKYVKNVVFHQII